MRMFSARNMDVISTEPVADQVLMNLALKVSLCMIYDFRLEIAD